MKVYLSLLFLLSINLVTASINLDCPSKVEVNEEFVCSLEISELEGTWDVKTEIKNGDKTVAKIYSEEKQSFQSAYYYLKEYIEDGQEKEITLKIEEEGEFDGVLKLRQESKSKTYTFNIEVEEAVNNQEKEISDNQENQTEEQTKKDFILTSKSENKKEETIFLNTPLKEEVKESPKLETVYESKSSIAIRYSPYAFSFFLIILLALTLREKF